MKPAIYDQHDKAFKNVQAFVVMKGTERVATIAFKFPADGAGRLYAYVHWFGAEMVRGFANGYGYDKKSAACESASDCNKPIWGNGRIPAEQDHFWRAINNVGGSTWDRRLRDAGFNVFQAV